MAAFTVAHFCMFGHFFLLFNNCIYLELMISRVLISAYQDWWMHPRCWSHVEGLSMYRSVLKPWMFSCSELAGTPDNRNCSWQSKFQECLSFPLYHCMRKTFLCWCVKMYTCWGIACCPEGSLNSFLYPKGGFSIRS